MEFEKPFGYRGSTRNISFRSKNLIDHDKAFAVYDEQNVKAIIQLETGNANVISCLNIVNMKFGHHPCVIGYGIDAEWYFYKESADKTGRPIDNSMAERWAQKVISFDPIYTLFLKHWDPSHMPPTFRHPNLWFLSDSQDFNGIFQMMEDFKNWAKTYRDSPVGFQVGYEKDAKWWKNMNRPTLTISHEILRNISNTQFLFWVDLTADKVIFR